MTKATASEGCASAAVQPASGTAIPKAVVAKAPSAPPGSVAPKRRGCPPQTGTTLPGDAQLEVPLGDAQPATLQGDAQLAPFGAGRSANQCSGIPKPKRALNDLCKALAESTGLESEEVKQVLASLREAAAKDLRNRDVFRLPDLVLLRRKKTPARPENTKKMFGKTVYIAAKPAGYKFTALVVKRLKDAAAAQ